MRLGSVAEWSIAPVLKTGNPKGFVSSNLTASANKVKKAYVNHRLFFGHKFQLSKRLSKCHLVEFRLYANNRFKQLSGRHSA
jgi:hypothetical protein